MEVTPGQIALAVTAGLILLGGFAWISWKVIKLGASPCFPRRRRNGGLWRHLTGENNPLLRSRAPRSSPYTHRPGYQAGASPTTIPSLSSSSSSRRKPPSMTKYADFSESNSFSSSEWGAASSSDATYVHIPPIPDSAKLTMSMPNPRNFPRRSDTDWTPSLRPVPDLARELVAVTVENTDDTGAAAASLDDINALKEAINALPSRLANIRTNYGIDDLRNHITRT